jgi:adenylosuccinate lyase
MGEQGRDYSRYQDPLIERYASAEMAANFSPQKKFSTWRRLWVALAKAEKELGLDITDEQIAQMERFVDTINFAEAEARERVVRHDVMAHVHAFGLQAVKAKPIIHLGATSCTVTDNADVIIMRDALRLVLRRLVNVIDRLAAFALKYKDLPALGFTHFQPAQPVTVGKRACLWIQDLMMDLAEIEHRLATFRLLGVKGTTGTQASFLELFGGDASKVDRLERRVSELMGFEDAYPVTGQTYPRKFDAQVLATLAGVAQSAHKFANDLRLLMHLQEVEEPFDEKQIGSSAMAYKRNPRRAELIAALARHVIVLVGDPAFTAATQWLERTLDDSANRRIAIPGAFLASDGMLRVYLNVASGLVVNEKVCRRRVKQELPFIATENLLMQAVKAGGDRQELHEKIRAHSHAAAKRMKEEGAENDLLERLKGDPAFAKVNLDAAADPSKFVGLAPRQTERFVSDAVRPALQRYQALLGEAAEFEL